MQLEDWMERVDLVGLDLLFESLDIEPHTVVQWLLNSGDLTMEDLQHGYYDD